MNVAERYGKALAELRAPIFLARSGDGGRGEILVLHTADRKAVGRIRRRASQAFGDEMAIKVVAHSPAAMKRRRSLESLVRSFGSGEIVYDPTMVASRAEAIVDCATRLRAALGDAIDGIFIDSMRRTLFVVLDARRLPAAATDSARALTVATVTDTFRRWQADRQPGFELAIRLGFEAPLGASLIAVDRVTTRNTLKRLLRRGAVAAAATSLFGLGVAVPAHAADPVPPPVYVPPPPPPEPGPEPAVAEPNWSILTVGAWYDGDGYDEYGWAAVGVKATLPLGHSFGFQGEAGIGLDEYYGFGAHLFWRDPAVGLVGAVASWETHFGFEMTRYGAEAELYLDWGTIAGQVGMQDGYTDNGLYGLLDVTFYVNDDLAITGGGEFNPDRSFGHIGFEWQPAMSSLPSLSVFADAAFGEDDYLAITAGINIHFGTEGVSLRDRERRYDPRTVIFNNYGDFVPGPSGLGGGGGGGGGGPQP